MAEHNQAAEDAIAAAIGPTTARDAMEALHAAGFEVYRAGEWAVVVEDLAKTKAERDRLLPFVIQKCGNCGAVTAPLPEAEHDCRWRRSMSVEE